MASQRKVFEVIWEIEKLKSWFQIRDDTLYSPQFLTETFENTRWKLCLSPNWELAEKYISLILQRDVEDEHYLPIDLNYELSILANDGSSLKSITGKKKFEPKDVSHELNVKQDEIFELKKKDYLLEGVLKVCCKIWKTRSTILNAGRCSIQSIIGIKRIVMQGTVNTSPGYQTVNFTSTSEDISLVSLDVYINFDLVKPHTISFQKNQIKCKRFSFCICELFLFTASGKKKTFSGNAELNSLLNPYMNVILSGYNFCNIIYHSSCDKLTLQLEITFTPAVESERIEYETRTCEETSSEDLCLENLNTTNAEKTYSSTSNDLEAQEREEKSFDTSHKEIASGMEHLLSITVKQDLTTLHGDQLFCDTKLRTDTETFPAHRCILSARSPVFKKMFTTDMKEKAGEGINVPDLSSDTVRRMLQFLYTECTGDLEMQSAKDLYIASDKYDIASLKHRCTFFMKKNFCVSNVCEILVLADMHQDKNLESAAQEYVLNYDEEVFTSDEWKLFMQNYSALAAQVMYLKCMKK